MGNTVARLMILLAGLAATALPVAAQSDAGTLVATQVREQGYECTDPVSAQRDGEADDDAVWILTCANGSYRVRLVPDQAAKIEQIN